jgi:unsaturated rhamnogalacturonyl hydrolase
MGRSLLFLYNKTGQTKYKTAAQKVRGQLLTHPRTSDGGFWHKQVYPYQMWLDGLYMGEPFYAEYSKMFAEPTNFDDISNQIILMEKHARDASTGLLYHGWDESKNQSWADPVTGCSPNFWGRSLGWYAMSLVDVLDHFPAGHTKRDTIVNILKRLSTAIVNYQDPATGLWYQVVDKAGEAGNYKEASASCMFVYALAKGYRKGYLDETKMDAALKGFNGIIDNFVSVDAQNVVHLNNICRVAGLGGNPYRDGSYAYYISEQVVTDDPKGVGAFILASIEIEVAEETVTSLYKEGQMTISVSPNPVTDKATVTGPTAQRGFTYTIFNSLGEQVFSGDMPEIDVSGWRSGVYYLKVQDSNQVGVTKIIKQ